MVYLYFIRVSHGVNLTQSVETIDKRKIQEYSRNIFVYIIASFGVLFKKISASNSLKRQIGPRSYLVKNNYEQVVIIQIIVG